MPIRTNFRERWWRNETIKVNKQCDLLDILQYLSSLQEWYEGTILSPFRSINHNITKAKNYALPFVTWFKMKAMNIRSNYILFGILSGILAFGTWNTFAGL